MAAKRTIDISMPNLAFPERLTIELTNDCNLVCTMCPRMEMSKNLGYMDVELYKKIIDEASRYTAQTPITLVPFFRGESLMHPNFFEMIELAKRAGLKPIQLTTNAMLLTEELSNKLIRAEIDFISFSVDVLGEEAYKRVRLGGDYKLVMSNIDKFLEMRVALGSKLPEVQVSTVETEENTESLSEFIDYWQEKVDRVRVYPEHSTDGSFGSLTGYELPIFDKRLPCRKVFTDMVVYWNGDVAVCNHDWGRKEFIGNVKDNTLAEIWTGDKYKEIRTRHMAGTLDDDPTCAHCDHWKMYYTDEGRIGKLIKKGA
ncbi:MAG: SPASM domain-containing protein [Deltaproteobacteria bacterium]|nr:SPASM domain-containing protein [Deltaproteobacteria bacterium]